MNEELSVREKIAAMKGLPTREELLSLLSSNVVEVTFKKLDGDERVMPCTLIADYLPIASKEDKLSQTKIRNLEEKVFVVWALESNSWRSFRYDRLINVKKLTKHKWSPNSV